MSTDESPRHVAATASNEMRHLAQATIALDDPADLYPLVGELLGSLRSLVQVTDQLAHAHMQHRGRARTDDGDASIGAQDADGAAWALVRARELLDAAESATDLASQNSGHIAWVPTERTERWLNVVFLQGADADHTLDLLERSEMQAAIRHLARWDYGDETTESALVNGYVYEGIPASSTDRTAQDPTSGYALIYNQTLGYVSLLRRFPRGPEDVDPPAIDVSATPTHLSAVRTRISPRRDGNRSVVRSVAL